MEPHLRQQWALGERSPDGQVVDDDTVQMIVYTERGKYINPADQSVAAVETPLHRCPYDFVSYLPVHLLSEVRQTKVDQKDSPTPMMTLAGSCGLPWK